MKPFNHEKALAIFKKAVTKWLHALGLLDWDARFGFNAEDCEAMVSWDMEGRIAAFSLSEPWLDGAYEADQPTQKKIEDSAFHEVAELLLVDLRETLLAHPQDQEKITSAVHSVVRRLENCLLKK